MRAARQLAEKGLKALRASDADLYGQYIAEDLYNPETGEIYAEAGEEITEKSLAQLLETGFKELPVLDIDHINIGAYIRNTLEGRQEFLARGRSVRHLSRHAPGRAADDRKRRGDVPVAVLRLRSATTSRRSAG